MSTALVTFEIRTRDMAAFEAEFAKLAKKASKLGVAAPTFEVVQRGKVIPARIAESGEVLSPARVVNIVRVSGQAPRLGGWSFLASLQHEDGGNIVRTVPGVDIQVAKDLRTLPPACEHCGLARRRNDTYVVAHEDGRQVQVGRSCLKDFTGHDSPEAVARWAELLAVFQATCETGWESDGNGYVAPTVTLDDILPFVCASIRMTGWLSRGQARDTGGLATADHAWQSRFPHPSARHENLAKPEEQDVTRAADVLAYARAWFGDRDAETLEDYLWNLRLVIEGGSVEGRTMGIFASVVNFVERERGREIERRRTADRATTSTFIGTVAKRETFTLTIEKVIDLDGAYGVSHLHLMADAAGNVVKWFSSSHRLEVGRTYTIKATVKAHETYQGVKGTVITRGKVED